MDSQFELLGGLLMESEAKCSEMEDLCAAHFVVMRALHTGVDPNGTEVQRREEEERLGGPKEENDGSEESPKEAMECDLR